MTAAVQSIGELHAPPAWRTVDFISDLHLDATVPSTVSAWSQYMAQSPAEAIIILGDLFEVWVGDDCLEVSDSFESRCVATLRLAATSKAVFFMHGNRDFLASRGFADKAQLQLLDDPTVLHFANQNWLLSHGDALCLADTDYMVFRNQVRDPAWQAAFLAQPLAERQAVARQIRQQSEARKKDNRPCTDIDPTLACQWLALAQAETLIHGHTHRPSVHALRSLGHSYHRVVLSDWDAAANPSRLQVLRLTADGLVRINL